MTGEGHIIFAIASAIFAKRAELTLVLGQADWWHLIPATLLTCLLPDIDHPKSLLGRRVKWLSYSVAHTFGHRGFTHSLLAVAFVLCLFQINVNNKGWLLLPTDVLQSLTLGYTSHIAADILTPAGVPLLWPCRWRFRLPVLNGQRGHHIERTVCVALVVYALWFPPSWPSHFLDTLQHRVSELIDIQKAY
ncbi:metal-dependent hydrolase [Pantoea sp. Nvir]|uniref:metal-dependent hydrolase n=1 Tax=Pantoea sp. Nvir TaxID=2576760 RepID=UPI00135734C5|nr:metal-dependent hydrolase [Pantoea sp. Nvir]MXP66217.1 metal-dependent hydrolase [Pantoea sp. Nvir]